VDILEIEASLEGRVRQDDVETLCRGFRELVGEARAQSVLVVDVGIIDAVQHKVHGGDAEHRGVKVEAVEHVTANMLAVRFQQIAGVGLFRLARLGIGLFQHSLGRGVGFQQILHRLDKEAAGAAGRIADNVGGLWFQHIDHQPDDVARRAELTVDASRGQLAEQVLVKIALRVAFGQRQLVDHVNGLHQKARFLDHELRVLHEFREGGAAGR